MLARPPRSVEYQIPNTAIGAADGRADAAEHREADIEHSATSFTPGTPVDMQASYDCMGIRGCR
ncbi:hypothetical protein [Halocatena halophila]|uniref:hypothetical protein n=1 Tax=Halocatena halophila TaxID=2814576 RepID=UPI002ED51A09